MKKEKTGPTPPPSDSEREPEPPPEIVPDPEHFDTLLQDVLDSVRKYRESQRRKEDPGPERDEG